MNKKHFIIILSVLTIAVVGIIVGGYVYKENIASVDDMKYVSLIALFISLAAALTGLITYVNKDIGSVSYEISDAFRGEIHSEIQKAKFRDLSSHEINERKINVLQLSEQEKNDIIESVKKRIAGNAILSATESLKDEVKNLREQSDIEKHYLRIIQRLESELNRLNRRGGVNLALGAVIAMVGILYLGATVSSVVKVNDKLGYIIHLLPRLSFVIVIEIFAYFFLRLYKNGFDEIKYFQNEITNIDSKVLGIKFLKNVKNEDLMSEVIKNLMATERNFILEKGQSTVEIERKKLKGSEDNNFLDLLKEIVKLKK